MTKSSLASSAPAPEDVPVPPHMALQRDLSEGLGHHQAGRLEEAERIYRRILSLDSRHADALHLLGMIEYQSGRADLATALVREAISLHPRAASYRCNLGNILQSQGQLAEAAAAYREALALQPNQAETHVNLGNVLQAGGELGAAIAAYERALAIGGSDAEAYSNLGNVHLARNELDEAVRCYRHALELKPDYATARYNLGCAFRALGRIEDALVQYRKALALQPDYADAHFNEALAELLLANFASGWPGFEWRWRTPDHETPMRVYPQPLWSGEALQGRVLLWREQGVGDEIMFAGLIPELARTGHGCILECDPRLQPLFARSFPAVEVIAPEAPAQPPVPPPAQPRALDIAAHLPTGSLPGLFRTSLGAFGAATSGYLVADPVAQARFRARYADGRRLIGLAWQTKNPKKGAIRSIDLSVLAPLFRQSNIRWISLQYGDPDALEAQAATAGAPLWIDREVDQFADLDSFAAQIAAMDLVVTIDNSTAHLAGALGVPTWVLLPFAPDWRWLLDRDDSPWYPSMLLFRQKKLGDWPSVVRRVLGALKESAAPARPVAAPKQRRRNPR